MLKQIDHIGIAVNDLKEVQETMRIAFNLTPAFNEVIQDQMVKVLGYHVGESTIEYLEATSSESPVSRYIEKKGSGLHHIAYRVENLSEALQQLKNKGFRLIDEQPREGAEGKRIAFVHPKNTNGILIELCELTSNK
jgi:methylmalonyl-CoA/ethylmalonyl-CoA epimerase